MDRDDVSEEISTFVVKDAKFDLKPNCCVFFHNGRDTIGTLDFNGPEMIFTGDADASAKLFIDLMAERWSQRLKDERAAEREACAETAICFVNGGQEIAEAIRARGSK